jgi:hypothetical protein
VAVDVSANVGDWARLVRDLPDARLHLSGRSPCRGARRDPPRSAPTHLVAATAPGSDAPMTAAARGVGVAAPGPAPRSCRLDARRVAFGGDRAGRCALLKIDAEGHGMNAEGAASAHHTVVLVESRLFDIDRAGTPMRRSSAACVRLRVVRHRLASARRRDNRLRLETFYSSGATAP